MNKIDKLNRIKTLLSRFETYVRLSNLSNEFDINRYSEDFIIPILNITLSLNLVNANKVHKKNIEAIDLIDVKRKLAIQVSSDVSIHKIRETIEKINSSELKTKITKIQFYFLKPKHKRYSSESINKLNLKKLKFNILADTLDNATLYDKIKSLEDSAKIDQILDLLNQEFTDFDLKDTFSYKDYEDFKAKYKQSCLNNLYRLNFFGLSIPKKPREIELYQLFVKPSFVMKPDDTLDPLNYIWFETSEDEIPIKIRSSSSEFHYRYQQKYFRSTRREKTSIDFKFLFDLGKHLVILGSPGAGKSSLIKYSICKIVEEIKEVFESEEIYYYLPIRVELHKYNRFKKDGKGGIIQYMYSSLVDEFQLSIKKQKIEYYLNNFPTLIFFDGLDEIFDIQERISVRNDIENFVQNNNISRTIVTSRYESYEEVKLNSSIYKIVEVQDFDKTQIKDYVTKWYNIEEANEFTRNSEIKNCLEQLKAVNDELKQNPLLLSLILILYRNEQDLPTSRLEIYEGCAQTLVDSRDKKEKKLDLPLRISNKISIFSNIAYLHFENEVEKKDIKFDYNYIKNFISELLISKGEFEDKETADEAAKEFFEYAKLRSIYFENKFTHKTFYEYFTSYYIFINFYSKISNKENLFTLITRNIGIASWQVILELLIHKIDQNQIDFEIIDSIFIEAAKVKPEESTYFFLSILKHLRNISPTQSKNIVGKTIYYLSDSKTIKKSDQILLTTNFENFKALLKIKKFRESFIKIINGRLFEDSRPESGIYDLVGELSFSIGEKDLKNVFNEIEYNIESSLKAKFYILNNIDQLGDLTKAIKSFEKFYHAFGKKTCLPIYKSTYTQALFDGNINFNWIIFLLNKCTTLKDIDLLYSRLIALNFNTKDFSSIFKQNKRTSGLTMDIIRLSSKSSKRAIEKNPLIALIISIYNPYIFDIKPLKQQLSKLRIS